MNKYILANQDIDTSFLTLEMTWRGLRDSRIKDQIGMITPDTFQEIIGGSTINTFIEESPFKEYIDACANTLINNRDLVFSLEKNTLHLSSLIEEYAKECFPKIDKFSDKELEEVIEKIIYLQSECVTYGTVVAFADFFGDISNKVADIIEKRTNLKYSGSFYSSILGKPIEKSLTEKAYEAIGNNKKNDEEFLREYFWLDQGYIGRGLTRDKLEEIKNHPVNDLSVSNKELEKELNLTAEEIWIFELSRKLVKIKSLRADSRQYLHVLLNRIVDLVSKKVGLDSQYLEVMPAEELISVINNKSVPDNLKDRWQHSVVLVVNRGYEFLLKEEANRFLKERLYKTEIKDNQVKGNIAFSGKVRGAAKLVFGPQHNSKVEEGDILISTATSPQLLPAMKRAAAFVTDVGGITSHAAIVARELKKPCIVGTKYATQIFNNGDMVEVDAEKGIVRKLS